MIFNVLQNAHLHFIHVPLESKETLSHWPLVVGRVLGNTVLQIRNDTTLFRCIQQTQKTTKLMSLILISTTIEFSFK